MASIVKSCKCGNVSLMDNSQIKVEFPNLLLRVAGQDGRWNVTCGNCNVATHSEAPDGRCTWTSEEKIVAERKSAAFGIHVSVHDNQLLRPTVGKDVKVERLLQNYVAQIKEEARAKIERAELEARALLIRVAAAQKKNNGAATAAAASSRRRSESLGEPKTSKSGVGAGNGRMVGGGKSVVTTNSLWAMDEDLDANAVSENGKQESPFPANSNNNDDEDEVELLNSSDPLLLASRRILFGNSSDRASLTAPGGAEVTMSHSLPVRVPSFGRRVRFDASAGGAAGDADNDDGEFVRPDVIAANTYQEQLRSEWVAKTKLGEDDVDFLVSTQSGAARGPRKKTML